MSNSPFHEEHPGLHPVQPGLLPLLDHDDRAPEVAKGQNTSLPDENVVPTSAAHGDHDLANLHTSEHRKMCGLRRRTFWLLFGAIVLVSGIAAAAGGVLGSRSRNTWVIGAMALRSFWKRC